MATGQATGGTIKRSENQTTARYGSIQNAAHRYGVSTRTLWRRVADKEIVAVRLGRKTLIDFEATDALLHRAA